MIKCRVCDADLKLTFCDLNISPLANSYRNLDVNINSEKFYPLKAFLCTNCKLVQLPEVDIGENIFLDYAYLSSYSSHWLQHALNLCQEVIVDFKLDKNDLITEIASNDGYLLKNFQKYNFKNILGIEPAKNIARIANQQNILTENLFFNEKNSQFLLKKYNYSKIIFSLNVLAHVPNVNSFVLGVTNLLHENGCWIIEFPHLLNLIKKTQFDTIYHEHFSYFSILALTFLLNKFNLRIFKIKKLSTHGGSLRVFVCHNNSYYKEDQSVKKIIDEETKYGLDNENSYSSFQKKVENKKNKIIEYLLNLNDKNLCGFGAPAKATTLINYCKIDKYFKYIIDNNLFKQNKYIPGTLIPIKKIDYLISNKPKNIIVLPWNINNEIRKELDYKGNFDYKIHTFDFE